MRKATTAIMALLLLWGVEGFSGEGERVLARVGEDVITLQEFLDSLPMLAVLSPQGDVEAGKRRLLENLINRLLFARPAVRLGLDQDPQVKAKLKQVRESILAQEYLRRQIAQQVVISEDDVKRYYQAHPEEYVGKALKDVEAQIKAKLGGEATNTLTKRLAKELREQEQITIDEKLLQEVTVAPPRASTLSP